MENSTYEATYKDENHFSFGKNWQNFLKSLNEDKLREAESSLVSFLGGEETIEGKTFIDLGCGSGLFSLAAHRLGASRVLSVDVDEFSLDCVKYLFEKEGSPENWKTMKGSALDENFIKSLGKFDIVYSWGVLHHTGNMYKALQNIISCVQDQGLLYIAIYNRHEISLRGGTSKFWFWVKKTYNSSSFILKKFYEFLFLSYGVVGMLVRLKNPWKEIAGYKSNRGMNWYHDRVDWIGGFPYEYASVEELINFYGTRGFACSKLKAMDGIGCNEFLFVQRAKI